MIVGVPRESYPGERRVALVPAVIPGLLKAGLDVVLEAGAGTAAGYPDADYAARGARILPERAGVFGAADVLVQVLCPGSNDRTGDEDVALLRQGQTLIGFLRPLGSIDTIQAIAHKGVSSLAVESHATDHAGSEHGRAVVDGDDLRLQGGTHRRRRPAAVVPHADHGRGDDHPGPGAGDRGRGGRSSGHCHRARLGAVTSAYDLRPAAKEQVQSLGGRFVELPVEVKDAEDVRGYARAQDESFYQRQRELLGRVVAESDVVITAAVVPGKKSPVLVTREMVAQMAPGSVIVDLAAERGGNCELTRAGERIVEHGVSLIGWFNLASTVPYHASQMYARNLSAFLQHLTKDGTLRIDPADEIVRETLVTHSGEVVSQRVREFFGLPVVADGTRSAGS